MLYSIDSSAYMNFTPYEDEFKIWRSRLTNEQYDRICRDLDSRVSGDEIHTSSWMPGSANVAISSAHDSWSPIGDSS